MTLFVTHARSLTELRNEFLSDLHRRLASLDLELKHEQRVGRRVAISRAAVELEATLSFWKSVELRGERKPERKLGMVDNAP